MKKFHYIILGALIGMLSLNFVACRQNTVAKEGQEADVSGNTVYFDVAPDFTLKDLDGNNYRLSDVKGKVLIIDFWATWCPPCQAGIPHFQALYEQYKGDGLEVIGISVDRGGPSVVKKFAERKGVTYPMLMADQYVIDAYGGIRGIPTTFVVGRDGKIAKKVVGYRDKAFFEEIIKELL